MRNDGLSHIGKVKQGGWWQIAVAAASAASDWYGRQQSKKAAGGAAYQNRILTEMESEEELRRMDRQQDFRMGAARAQYGAGGILTSSASPESVLDELQTEYDTQRAYFEKVAKQRARVAGEGGQGVGVGGALSAASTIVQGFGSWYTSRETGQ